MKARLILGIAAFLVAGQSLADTPLTLAEAERLALDNDPMRLSLMAKADALNEQAISDGQLPDPMLKLGAMNLPTDSFKLDQEPMTQLQVGVIQRFPRGDSLEIATARGKALSQADQHAADNQQRKARRMVRLAWLDTYYWVHAGNTVRSSQELFKQLVDITHSRYAVGGRNQQDVINANLELNLLADREQDILTQEQQARAQLGRWVGSARAVATLPPQLPDLSLDYDRASLINGLTEHPYITAQQAKVQAAQQGIALAREAYKPGWSLDLTYGRRSGQNPNGSDRPDFVSAMVMLDLPFQTANRQDRRLVASEHRKTAAVQMRQARLLDLQQQAEAWSSRQTQLAARIHRYNAELLPQARQNAEAAINAYQTDSGDFTMLMRARITELNTELQALKLRVEHAKAQAELRYLAGDPS